MTQTVQLEVISPENLLFSEHVEMVVVPSTEGDFGVLIQHAPLLSILRPGVVTIYQDGQIIERIFVSGGFAEITATSVTILAKEASILSSIKREEIEKKLSVALEILKSTDVLDTRFEAEAQVASAEAMLTAISLYN